MQSLSTRITSKPEERKDKDEDDLFNELLGTQLLQLNPRDKLPVKMKINNTVYNQLMKPPMSTLLDHDQAANSFSAEIFGNLTFLQPAKQFHHITRVFSLVHKPFDVPNAEKTEPRSFNTQFNVPSSEEIEARAQFLPRYFFHG